MGYFPPPSPFPLSSVIPPVQSPNNFQWPTIAHHPTSRIQDQSPTDPWGHSTYHKTGLLEGSSLFGVNLPDFETVFTTLPN